MLFKLKGEKVPNFEVSISRQGSSQSIQTLLSGKQPLNPPSHLKRKLSAYSFDFSPKFNAGKRDDVSEIESVDLVGQKSVIYYI